MLLPKALRWIRVENGTPTPMVNFEVNELPSDWYDREWCDTTGGAGAVARAAFAELTPAALTPGEAAGLAGLVESEFAGYWVDSEGNWFVWDDEAGAFMASEPPTGWVDPNETDDLDENDLLGEGDELDPELDDPDGETGDGSGGEFGEGGDPGTGGDDAGTDPGAGGGSGDGAGEYSPGGGSEYEGGGSGGEGEYFPGDSSNDDYIQNDAGGGSYSLNDGGGYMSISAPTLVLPPGFELSAEDVVSSPDAYGAASTTQSEEYYKGESEGESGYATKPEEAPEPEGDDV